MVQPVVTYRSEVRATIKNTHMKLITSENRLLRRIPGPIKRGDVRIIKGNKELYKHPDGWDLLKEGKSITLKKVWSGRSESTRPLRRP